VKKTNLPVRYRIAREIVAVVGTVELILGVYIGYLFGSQETFQAWLFVCILGMITYGSTRLWIWCLEILTGKTDK